MNFKDLGMNRRGNHNLREQGISIHSISGFSSQGSRNHHLRDQGIIISAIKGLSFQVSRDQKMNLKDLVMNVKDQELIILGIMGSSS